MDVQDSRTRAEAVARRVIGAAIEVHRNLGPGYLESVYHSAMRYELRVQGVPFSDQCAATVYYKGHAIHGQRIDLLVGGCLVVELKAVARIERIHVSQVVSYLKATNLRLGLLVNFNVRWLKDGLKRVVR
ncbi:MAG: GxxExxY protein [Vicinamibacteria bacterium]